MQAETRVPPMNKERKRTSRTHEACSANGLIFIIISQLGGTVTIRKTKKTKETVKMYIPESIDINGHIYDQNELQKCSDKFMKEEMNSTPIDVKQMNTKQFNKSREAYINNGMLEILKEYGYKFQVKSGKTCTCTERFIKVSSITTPFCSVIDSRELEVSGEKFGERVESLFGKELIASIDYSSIRDIPEVTQSIPVHQLAESQSVAMCSQSYFTTEGSYYDNTTNYVDEPTFSLSYVYTYPATYNM